MTLIEGLIGLVVLALLAWSGYEIHWHIKYKKEYSEIKIDTGVVTDMDYTAPRTTTNFNGKGTTTSTQPAKHEVYIKFNTLGERNFNHEKLYETVRLDDEIKAEYQEVWRVEKENPRNKTFMRNEILSITSEKGRKVEL